jgi:hypothetical protein
MIFWEFEMLREKSREKMFQAKHTGGFGEIRKALCGA